MVESDADEEAWDALERRLDEPSPTKKKEKKKKEKKEKDVDDDDDEEEEDERGRSKKKKEMEEEQKTNSRKEKEEAKLVNDEEFSDEEEEEEEKGGEEGDKRKKKRFGGAVDDVEGDGAEDVRKENDKNARTAERDLDKGKRDGGNINRRDRLRDRSCDDGAGDGRRWNRSRSRDYYDDRRGGGSRGRRGKGRRARSTSRDRETPEEREAKRRRRKEERRQLDEKRALEKIDRDTRTCFAYNLSTKSGEREIFKFFMKAGEVTDVKIIYDRNWPISKGMAYVEFKDKASISKALELTGQTLRGQKVMVKHSEAEKNIAWEAEQASKGKLNAQNGKGEDGKRIGPCALFVAGLHAGLAEEDVKAVFEPFGALDAIEISRNQNNQSNGHGIVRYREWSHAMLAVSQLNGLELVGQALKISIAAGQGGANDSDKNKSNNDRKRDEDEDDRGGQQMDDSATFAKMDALKRAELMQKLAGGDASNIAAIPTATLTHNAVKIKTKEEEKREQVMLTQGYFGPPSPIPTPCILLKNLFDPTEETDEEWWLDIEDDVKGEVSKYGQCLHAFVDKENPHGFCYLKFEEVEAAKRAQFSLNNRWFAGRSIICEFQFAEPYNKHFKL